MWNPPNVYIANFKMENDKNMKINQNMTVGWNWPMSGLQVFARLNYVMYERKPILALVRWACLVEFLRQTASDHVGWREWTGITNFFPLWEAPCLLLYLLCLELMAKRETPELFLWGQWRVCSGKTREIFEAFPTAELGEGKKEKDKDPCIGTPYLRGTLLWITTPSSHHPPMWHIQSKDLVIQSHISLLNCPCHLSHLEIELHTFPAQFPVCLKWARLVRRYCEGSVGTGFVGILPEWGFWRQQTSIWWSTGRGTGVGYLWFQAGAERSTGSQVFPMPWRETLSSILCCFSSVRTQGIAPEDEEQWDECNIWVEQVSIFLDKMLSKCKVAHLLCSENSTNSFLKKLFIQCRGSKPRTSGLRFLAPGSSGNYEETAHSPSAMEHHAVCLSWGLGSAQQVWHDVPDIIQVF